MSIDVQNIHHVRHVDKAITSFLRKEIHHNFAEKVKHITASSIPKEIETSQSLNDSKRLQLGEYHIPAIQAGKYTISATLNSTGETPGTYTSKTHDFEVSAPRYAMPPKLKHFVYPPNNSSGQNDEVIPHIIINRSTFPWERKSALSTEHSPWLALILLTESDTKKIPIAHLTPKKAGFDFPSNSPSDQSTSFNFLTINGDNNGLIQQILPKLKKTPYLAHTVTTIPKGAHIGEEMATLMANRLPITKKEQRFTAHVISLEDKLIKHLVRDNQEWDTTVLSNITNTNPKYLASLYSWSFFSKPNSSHSLMASLENIQITELGDPHSTKKLNTYLNKGYIPMPHHLRRGDKTISWYRGPIVPSGITIKTRNFKDMNAADNYLFYDTGSSLLDTSYAAAWQLGRNLTLENKSIARALYEFRNQLCDTTKKQILNHTYPSHNGPIIIPKPIQNWVNDLFLLKHIPFNYLIAHPDFLKPETIQFIQIDFNWLVALIEGVLSIGQPDKITDPTPLNINYIPLQGAIVRSSVIADYPDIHIVASENTDGSVSLSNPIISRKIGADIHLLIFKNETPIKSVGMYGKPRARHFGVRKAAHSNDLYKLLRQCNSDSSDMPNYGKFVDSAKLDNLNSGTPLIIEDKAVDNIGCINVKALLTKMETIRLLNKAKIPISIDNSAQFAFHMIEGTPRVNFSKPT